MWGLLLATLAMGGDVVVDAAVPVEVWVDGKMTAQLFEPGTLTVPASPGKHTVRLVLNARPTVLEVDVPEKGGARIVVGRTGITMDTVAPADPSATTAVKFRSTGTEALWLMVDGQKHVLLAKETLDLALQQGHHEVSLRNGNGTVVWAKGSLVLDGAVEAVVQISEGRAPEVVGSGARFSAAVP